MLIEDALGNDIVIGNFYGYSVARNGINTIHFGQAVRITPKGLVSLDVKYTKTGAYEAADFSATPEKAISVKPILIFPVDINNLKLS